MEKEDVLALDIISSLAQNWSRGVIPRLTALQNLLPRTSFDQEVKNHFTEKIPEWIKQAEEGEFIGMKEVGDDKRYGYKKIRSFQFYDKNYYEENTYWDGLEWDMHVPAFTGLTAPEEEPEYPEQEINQTEMVLSKKLGWEISIRGHL